MRYTHKRFSTMPPKKPEPEPEPEPEEEVPPEPESGSGTFTFTDGSKYGEPPSTIDAARAAASRQAKSPGRTLHTVFTIALDIPSPSAPSPCAP